MLDFNTEPFFNDFSEDNKFYSILFRPSVAVQARELNQFQTILQNQISQHGSAIFKNGTVVIPGEFDIKPSIGYLKLSSLGNVDVISKLIGVTVQNTTDLQATIVHAVEATTTDPATLYLSYSNSANDNSKVFANNDVLTSTDSLYTGITAAATSATGNGSLSTINRGVYYVNGYFVLCDTQTIILDKYSVNSTYRIGFTVSESVKTSDDTGYESLLDNAQGSSNYAAPGANRYYIDLVLTALTLSDPSESFIELGRVVDGTIITMNKVTSYSQLEKTFARRTYDESGDYTVKPFAIDVREHRNNDRGTWLSSNTYLAGDVVINAGIYYTSIHNMIAGLATPVHTSGIVNYWEQTTTPIYNRGVFSPDAIAPNVIGDINQLAIGFEPGKAYVQGYELEKLATTYVSVEKTRNATTDIASITAASIPTTVGSFVEVTEFHKLPPMATDTLVNIHDAIVTTAGTAAGNIIGTCRVRGVQVDGLYNGVSTICKMFICDVKLNVGKDFVRNAKSFSYPTNTFTTNINYINSPYSRDVGIATWGTNPTVLVGVGTRWNTTGATKIAQNDWVYFGGYKAQVSAAVTSDTSLTITGITAVANAVGGAVSRIQTQLNEPEGVSLVFPLPNYATNSLTNHIYYVTQTATIGTVSGNTLNITVPAGTLLPDSSNYYVQDGSGDSIASTGFTVSALGGTAALTFATAPNTSYTVFATVNKTGVSARKIKTLTSTSQTFLSSTNAVNKSVLNLSNTDCYKIVNIMMGTTDISNWYTFNSGQKDSYYDYGSITLIPSYPTPSANITVNYQYFAHSAGDFCDLGSYTNIDYSMIPYYSGISLRDAIDFRPNRSSFTLSMPKRGYNMNADLSYYLARQDKIAIDINGNIFNTKGSSSLNPGTPTDSTIGMTLCSLLLFPYVFTTSEVIVTKSDNKRYTMRDIGKLESRINNLEYYTSLSLLEQETSSLSITDANGLDRFKNGFIVDNFTGHNIGDIASPDYLCAIDMAAGELRPFASMDNINLLVDTAHSINYKMYGDLVTLPLDTVTPHVVLAQNSYASRVENVNPFAVFTFLGNVKMNPSSDTWFEVKRLPDIVTNKEGNFTILTQLAAKAGILGPVWNAWQTQWAGAPVETTTYSGTGAGMAQAVGATGQAISLSAGLNRRVWGWALYAGTYSVTTTTAQQVGQSRTGINTQAVAKIDTQVVDDKVLSVAVIPYMRSRYVLIQAKGLKPKTTFYPFFDDVSVSSSCTVSTVITYTPVSGSFDAETNSGINASLDSSRTISGDTQVCLNIGDVITGSTSDTKAVVVGKERIYSNTGVSTYVLYVMNMSGSFTTNEIITGSISGAVGNFLSSTLPTSLISGASGDLNLLFYIPNTDAVRFRTGTREFKLLDNNNATGAYTSRGVCNYEASGTIQSKQANVVATRNVQFVETQISENRTIVNTSSRVVSGTAWYDPLAQTFLVDSTGGAFLSKIDLFFASKDGNIPITVEIREVVNGYPGAVILPFSKVTVKPENIVLSGTKVTVWDGVSWPKYDTPTTVTFPSPVYVKDKTEYAIVLVSDSDSYNVWISQMGDHVPESSDTISKQPYLGVLFKSQNASTWTASQDQDLKFTLYRANFNTSVIGDLVLTNDKLSKVILDIDPIQTLAGSSTVRVWHRNHGFKSGDSVTFSGAASSDTTVTPVLLNTTFSISNPQLDNYTIVVGANATSTGFIGGTAVLATRSVIYETLQPNISSLGFSETNIDYAIKTTEASTGALNIIDTCIVNDNNYFYTPKVVQSGSTGQLNVYVTMSSTNSALSPVIDTHGTSVVAVRNKIDSPTEANTNIPLLDDVVILSAVSCTLSGVTLATAVSTNQAILQRIIPGTYIMFTGSTTNSTSNSVKFLVTAVDATVGTLTLSRSGFTTFVTETIALTIKYYNSFYDEISPIGSSTTSKYVSKAIALTNQSNLLRVRYAVCCPTEADVFVYYKIGNSGTNFLSTDWVLLNPDVTMPKTAIGNNIFSDVDYTADSLSQFSIVMVKLVMKSTNTASVPRVKDLRIIACAQ